MDQKKKTLQDTRIRKTPEKKYKQNIKTQFCESINQKKQKKNPYRNLESKKLRENKIQRELKTQG